MHSSIQNSREILLAVKDSTEVMRSRIQEQRSEAGFNQNDAEQDYKTINRQDDRSALAGHVPLHLIHHENWLQIACTEWVLCREIRVRGRDTKDHWKEETKEASRQIAPALAVAKGAGATGDVPAEVRIIVRLDDFKQRMSATECL